ncbi:Fic family protein [soil metagenome]
MTFRQFLEGPPSISTRTAWYLADVAEALGKQELFTRQAPQKLKALREHALVESAVSSNRIEGVEVEHKRIGTVVFGKATLRDRDEEEVRGYRKALDLIHTKGSSLSISEATIRKLHALSRGGLGDAGEYKQNENDIIAVHPGGRREIRFRTVSAIETPTFMAELIERWKQIQLEREIPPLIALGMLNLDFLCIHPFRDGNGRASRLLLLLSCYHAGVEVGRYISLERLIEQNKERYYEVLKLSSDGWHQGKHNPWHYINFLLYTLKEAYQEFESRAGDVKMPRGEKQDLVKQAIQREPSFFTISDLQRNCPGVSVDMIRLVLKQLREKGSVECLSRGRNARWQRVSSRSR